MSLAVRIILGVSFLALMAGCDGGDDGGGVVAVGGGSSSSAGAPAAGAGAPAAGAGAPSGGGGAPAAGGGAPVSSAGLAEGVPLTSADGWVDGATNTLGIQGAMFAYADDTSKVGLTEDFLLANACIKGTAAKVDLKCTPVAPAADCYGTFWGAAIGLNLKQAINPTTMMGDPPTAYDATALKGFAFEISGAAVPTSLRFKVESATGEFCNPALKPVLAGANSFLFSDLIAECWKVGGASSESAKSGIVKIAWQVVTNSSSTVPFDYCVSNVRALQ